MTETITTTKHKVELLRGLALGGPAAGLWIDSKSHSLSSLENTLVRGDEGSYSASVNGARGCVLQFTKSGGDGISASYAGPPVLSSRSAAAEYRERDGQFPVSVVRKGTRAAAWARSYIRDIQQTTALRAQQFLVLLDPALVSGETPQVAREVLDDLAAELGVAIGVVYDDGACEGASVYPLGHQPSAVTTAEVERLAEAQRQENAIKASLDAEEEAKQHPWRSSLQSLHDSLETS